MLKKLPNTLSILRIILCVPLMIFAPFSLEFMVAYTIAGVSDMIDGPIARRVNSTSELGANLDGAADFLMALVVLFRMVPALEIPFWAAIWIPIIVCMKFTSTIIAFMRYKEFVLLHTYANKFAAFALFTFPFLYLAMELHIVLLILCIIATIAFLEDITINSFAEVLDRNVKGLFFK